MNFISRDRGDSGIESVETVCVDQFCKDHSINRIDLMKLDIQEHEHSALKGAEQLIRSGDIGIIFLELTGLRVPKTTCAATESIRLLEQAGYRFSRPGKR
ncbi:MAG: FkbM family methyltransferase [Terriglobales bacterium]